MGFALKKLFIANDISSFLLYSVFINRTIKTVRKINWEMRDGVIFIEFDEKYK